MTDGTDRPAGNGSGIPEPRDYQPTIPSGTPMGSVPGSGFGSPSGGGGQQPGSADWPTSMGGPAGPSFPLPSQPDWQSLANQHEGRMRRRKWRITAVVVVAACALGAGVGFAVLKGVGGGDEPKSGPSAGASATTGGKGDGTAAGKEKEKEKNSPLVPGEANLLADKSGQSHLALGPDALVTKVPNGHVLRLRSNPNSFAQSADQLVDVRGSFTVSAWVQNEAPGGTRVAISQGDGVSYSFELGREDDHGKLSWFFRVQNGDKGADSTTVKVNSKGANTVNTWALLTAVHDAGKKSVTLYVDGKPAATAKTSAVWSGPGPLQVGRSRHHSIWGSPWAGVLGHVMVWDTALSAEQAAALKKGSGLTEDPSASWLIG
ncbi:LamG domain-containing protein [Streptomyces polyrhachis]|uniref:LamG domain-containing protein n=1 Tax=Streptomyces polyrhachis TaxID=1282885 RepID=A0ABW2GB96_9ACTN